MGAGPAQRSADEHGSDEVAVVIPVGSLDERLPRQLRAVLQQTGVELSEVVLSLNSADPAVRVGLDKLNTEIGDSRVRVVDSSARRGAAHARNVGMRNTSASKVAFCDADDLVHDAWLAPLVAALEKCDAVSGHVLDVFPDERTASWHPPATPGGLPTFLGRPYLLTGSMAIRRAAFDEVGGFDESLTRCEDIAISWALQDRGLLIDYVAESVLDYHHRAGLAGMLRQHYLYGLGMAEVLKKYGGEAGAAQSPFELLRPNAQQVGRRTWGGTMRRMALGAGRVRGLMSRR